MDLTKLAFPGQTTPAAGPKPPENAPQAAAPVPAGQTETVDSAQEVDAELHTDHGTPDTAAAEAPSEEVAAEAMPADQNQGPGDTFNTAQPADQPSIQNLRDPNAAPDVGDSRPGTLGSVEDQGNQAQVPTVEEEATVCYSSYPAERFGMGPWIFENGQLRLTPSEAEKFDKALAQTDPRTRATVKKIDVSAAEAFLAKRNPQASKRIDSVDPLTQARTEVGTEELANK